MIILSLRITSSLLFISRWQNGTALTIFIATLASLPLVIRYALSDYWTLGYMMTKVGAAKLIEEKPLGKMVPVDEYLPIMYDRHPNDNWKSYYHHRNLRAFSVHPLLLFPTHYTGEQGYISDTENTELINHSDDLHDEL